MAKDILVVLVLTVAIEPTFSSRGNILSETYSTTAPNSIMFRWLEYHQGSWIRKYIYSRWLEHGSFDSSTS
jgi:hypothetical protein